VLSVAWTIVIALVFNSTGWGLQCGSVDHGFLVTFAFKILESLIRVERPTSRPQWPSWSFHLDQMTARGALASLRKRITPKSSALDMNGFFTKERSENERSEGAFRT
jgi:hypothetical protein